MRLLRIVNIIQFIAKGKNKRKVINLLNIGIFLSIFAVTTALISFFTEREINKLEFGILDVQDIRSEIIETVSLIENINNQRNYTNVYEYLNQQDNILLTELAYGSMAISEKDFYSPIIYYFSKSDILKENLIYTEKKSTAMMEFSSEGLQKDIKTDIDDFFKSKQIVSKIDFEEYKKNLFDISYSNLISELNEEVENKRYLNNGEFKENLNEAYLDYNSIELLQTHAINYEEAYLNVWRAMENNLVITIKNFEEKIINYSKNERLYILITFIIQFIIFSFIQFFELSSLPKIINKKS